MNRHRIPLALASLVLVVASGLWGWWRNENSSPKGPAEAPQSPSEFVEKNRSSRERIVELPPPPGEAPKAPEAGKTGVPGATTATLAGNSGGTRNQTRTGTAPESKRVKRARKGEVAAVIEGIGLVEVLDWSRETDAAGKESVVQLVKASGKVPFLRVIRSSRYDPPTIMAADHVLVQFDPAIPEEQIRKVVEAEGYRIRKRFRHEGLFAIESAKDPALNFVPEAIDSIAKTLPGVQAVEPDYMVFAEELSVRGGGKPTYRPPEEGIVWDSVSALNSSLVVPPRRSSRDSVASGVDQITPASLRTITLDPPTFLSGYGTYAPYADEQNIRFEHSQHGVLVQDERFSDDYPDNGGYYMKVGGNEVIKHSQGLAFTLHGLDVSEFSAANPASTAITLKGYKSDGSILTHRIDTDGEIDGTGPLADFETFDLPATFTDLLEVRVHTVTGASTTCLLDNIRVTVEGQETPAPAPPPLPMIYDMTFDPPIHQIDEIISIGGHYAPKSINFGAPYVRSSIGGMTNAVELRSGDGGFNSNSIYEQFRVALGQRAAGYRIEMDVYIDSIGPVMFQDDFAILFDGPPVQSFRMKEDNKISIFQSGVPGGSGDIGTHQLKTVQRLRFDLDMENGSWTIFLGGNIILNSAPFNNSQDIDWFRVHWSDGSSGNAWAAVDNIQVWAFGPGEIGNPDGPQITVSPDALSFGNTQTGLDSFKTLRLENSGDEALNVSSIVSDNPVFSTLAGLPIVVPVGGFEDVPIRFTPTAAGNQTGQLTIVSNDVDNSPVTVALNGTGFVPAGLTLSAESFNANLEPGQSELQTLTLQNTGTETLSWNLDADNGSIGEGAPNPPNDPLLPKLWGMKDPAVFPSGIGATEAWRLTTGSPQVLVGVIDTGIDYTHADLADNIWVNEDEIPGNGQDDDNNGFVDDVRGWDFYYNDADPMDGHRHGTHVAGTIGARGNNGVGVVGVGWSTRLMAIKFLSDRGSGWTSDAIEAVDYATENGAALTNNSWGGGGYSYLLRNAIVRAGDADSLFVAAAGNQSIDNDARPHYPSSYENPNVVAVASTNHAELMSYFSNYGATSVDLGAPGSSIYSCLPNDHYGYLSGTSMATPHVAGALALVLSQDPDLDFRALKQRILDTVDPNAELAGKTVSGGRLNVLKALRGSGQAPWLTLSKITGSLSPGQSDTVDLTFDTSVVGYGQFSQMVLLNSNDIFRPKIEIPVTLNVADFGPIIIQQPRDQTLQHEFDGTISVLATTDTGPLSFQWYEGDAGDTSQPVGADSRHLTLLSQTEDTRFWVRITDSFDSVDSDGATVTVVPTTVTGTTATDGLFEDRVRVLWDASGGAVSYNVYRATTNSFSFALLQASVNGTIYEDTSAIPGTQYYYFVRAVDGGGDEGAHEVNQTSSGRRASGPLDGSLIPVRGVTGLSFDGTDQKIYVSTGSGYVEQYDVSGRRVSKTFVVGGRLGDIDISPDDSFLLITDSVEDSDNGKGYLHRIDLADDSITPLPYDLGPGEIGSHRVSIFSGTSALVTTLFDGEGSTPFRELDPVSGIFAVRNDLGSPVPGMATGGAVLARSANRLHGLVVDPEESESRFHSYDAATDAFGPSRDLEYSPDSGAVSRDGSVLAVRFTTSGCNIHGLDGSYLATVPFNVNALQFSPVVNELYVADWRNDAIQVVNTVVWKAVATLPISSDIEASDNLVLKTSSDGKSLALQIADGVRLLDISDRIPDAPPAAPTNLTATDDSPYWVILNWDVVPGAERYRVFRHTADDPASSVEIANYEVGTRFVDSTAEVDTPYFYWVKSVNLLGESDYSPVAPGIRPAPLITITSQPEDFRILGGESTRMTVGATSNSAPSLDYQWYEGEAGDTSTPVGFGSRNYLDRTNHSSNASYWVRVSDAFGSVDSEVARVVVIPGVPGNITATSGLFSDRIRVTWSGVPDGVNYQVYRGTSPLFSSSTLLSTVPAPLFEDFTALPGVRYYYFVKAVDADGDAGDPDEVSSAFRDGILADGPLDGSLIPIRDVAGVVFDGQGQKLLISTESGIVEEYDIGTRVVSRSFNTGGRLRGVDISADDSFLLAADANAYQGGDKGRVHRIDLAGGAVTPLEFDLIHANELGSYDVAIFSGSSALVTTDFDGTGFVYLRELNPQTGGVVLRTDVPYSGIGTVIRGRSLALRNRDRSHGAILDGTNTSGSWFAYTAAGKAFGGTQYLGNALHWGSVNWDGSKIALSDHPSSAKVFRPDGTLNRSFPGELGGACFSPAVFELYLADSQADAIRGFGTESGQELFTLPIPDALDWNSHFGEGTLEISPDGKTLALVTAKGVRLFDIADRVVSPSPPDSLTMATTAQGSVTVDWTPQTNTMGYKIYRSTTDDSTTSTMLADDLTDSFFEDTTIDPGTVYYYWIKSFNRVGDSDFSGSNYKMLLLPPTFTTSNGSAGVQLNWNPAAGATEYKVYRGSNSSAGNSALLTTVTNGTSHTDTTGDVARNYYYFVRSGGAGELGRYSTGQVGTRLHPAPGTVEATERYYDDRVRLSWSGVAGALEYAVYRNTSAEFDGAVEIARVEDAGKGYSDTTAAPGVDYFYSVMAVMPGDAPSALSDWVKGKRSAKLAFLPDEQIGKNAASMLGDGIYNESGAGQTLRVKSKRRRKPLRFYIELENDGVTADTLTVIASGGNRLFRASYTELSSGGGNVTAAVTAGVFAKALRPGEATLIELRVKRKGRKTKRSKRKQFSIMSSSAHEPGRRDSVIGRAESN